MLVDKSYLHYKEFIPGKKPKWTHEDMLEVLDLDFDEEEVYDVDEYEQQLLERRFEEKEQ